MAYPSLTFSLHLLHLLTITLIALTPHISQASSLTKYRHCSWWKPSCSPMDHYSKLDLFHQYITSSTGGPAYFDNAAQVRFEKETGATKDIHPYTRHVNYDITHRILNRPKEVNSGFYVVEETYGFKRGNRTMNVSPLLLLFDLDENEDVRLTSLKWPEDVSDVSLIGSNPFLYFNHSELVISPTFSIRPSYKFDAKRKVFLLDSSVKRPDGLILSLIETIGPNRLVVLGKLQAAPDGPNIIGAETPVLYDRLSGYNDFFHEGL